MLVPATLAVVGVATVVMLGLLLMLRYTRFGRAIVAVYENPTGAAIVGISVQDACAAVGLASLLAAVAGILVAPLITLSPGHGDHWHQRLRRRDSGWFQTACRGQSRAG